MGRPPKKKITEETHKLVKTLAGLGCTWEFIANELGYPVSTLRVHCTEDFRLGGELANTRMAKRLFEKGMGGDTAAMCFWLKCRARWREVPRDDDSEKKLPTIKIEIETKPPCS